MKTKSAAGFTLIEILLYSGLAAIVGALLVSSLVSTSGIFFRQNATVSQGVSINYAMSQITESIKQSTAVVSSMTVGSDQYNSNSTTLLLAIPSLNASKQVISNTYDIVIITPDDVNPNLLKRYVVPNGLSSRSAEDKVLTNSFSNINIEYLDGSGNGVSPVSAARIRVTIKLSEKAGYSPQESSASSTINLKNI